MTVGDGFKFGCGALLAGAMALVILGCLVAFGFFMASVLNVPLPRPTP